MRLLQIPSIACLGRLFHRRSGAGNVARTVQYHSQDIVPIHAKVKYTTLIEVPRPKRSWRRPQATRISGLWMWWATSALCIRRRPGISSNLNLITDKGNIYTFTLQDVSGTSASRT